MRICAWLRRFKKKIEQVYELDGLKPGPILLGEYGSAGASGSSSGDWLSVAGPAITSRIQRYASSEIRFNLMGIVKVRAIPIMLSFCSALC